MNPIRYFINTEEEYFLLPYISNSKLGELERKNYIKGERGLSVGKLFDRMVTKPDEVDNEDANFSLVVQLYETYSRSAIAKMLNSFENQAVFINELALGVVVKCMMDKYRDSLRVGVDFKVFKAHSESGILSTINTFDIDRQVAHYMICGGLNRYDLCVMSSDRPKQEPFYIRIDKGSKIS